MKPIERNSREETNIEPLADHHHHHANPPENQNNIEHHEMQPEENYASDDGDELEQNNNNNIEVARERQVDDHMLLQWRLLIVEICFAAIGVAVQALQTPNPLNTTFQFRCFRIAMVHSFTALLMSVYMYRYCESVALIFEHAGVFFGVIAFLLAITMD